MLLKEKISLETFGDKHFRIKLVELDNNQEAILTHYLHNSKNGVSEFYKKDAVQFAKKILEHRYPEEKITSEVAEEALQYGIFETFQVPFPPVENPKFTFIDLFAGIGGFRLALQNIGGKCVFTSEWDKDAKKTYKANFGETPIGDITKEETKRYIPNGFDVLCAGFPCQPFSISGKMKGFEDTRGTLIYHILKIIQEKRPNVVFLENVKHLLYHDNKKTLTTIVRHLEELGYFTSVKLLNAVDFGLPQNRERVIIVAHQERKFDFFTIHTQPKTALKHFLDKTNDFEYMNDPYTILHERKEQKSGLIFAGFRNKKTRDKGVRPGTEHLSRVHKQPNRIYSTEGVHPTLPSQESSGRFWILHEGKVRKLTIEECYRIMGFPKNFRLVCPKAELYKQIGNSVAIPMIEAVGQQIQAQFLSK